MNRAREIEIAINRTKRNLKRFFLGTVLVAILVPSLVTILITYLVKL
jgi:hypothetical protein